MSLMSVSDVAAFLDLQDVRVERLARESLLVPSGQDDDGKPLFKQEDVEKYKAFAEKIGGL